MIKLENHEVIGWEHAIRGMRNPMNSWEKSDSGWDASLKDRLRYTDHPKNYITEVQYSGEYEYDIGPEDAKLMMKLRNAGTDHRKFMRMITVYVDITAPLYWWKEFDTYKVGTVANSCSTMHKIHEKEFTLDDFSCELLIDEEHQLMDDLEEYCKKNDLVGCLNTPLRDLEYDIERLNAYRYLFLQTKNRVWWDQMIQRLPSSYNQKRTIMFNYEVLANIYKSRRTHKLHEWHQFCDWIETLPYSEIITGDKKET